MPKYLWQVTYSPSGAAGLQQEGGTARRDAIMRMVEASVALSNPATSHWAVTTCS